MSSRRRASSLLALSAVAALVAGCGGAPSADEVQRAFEENGMPLRAVDIDELERQQPRSGWGAAGDLGSALFRLQHAPRTPRAIFLPLDTQGIVIAIEIFRGAGDAVRELRLAPESLRGGSFQRATRVGPVVVFWDRLSGPRARAALERTLDSLR